MIAQKNKNKFVTTIKTNIMHDILFYKPLTSRFSCITNGILFDEQKLFKIYKVGSLSISRRPIILSISFIVIPIFLTIPNFLALTIMSRPYRPSLQDIKTTMATELGVNIDCLPHNRNGTHTMCEIPEQNLTDTSLDPSR